MFTLFDALVLFGSIIGGAIGVVKGWHSYGAIGAAVGAVLGLAVGAILGNLPWWFVANVMRVNLKWSKTETLRAKIDRQPFVAHLLIAELLSRGEPLESFREAVTKQLQSSSPLEREFGERNAKLWFPDLLPGSK